MNHNEIPRSEHPRPQFQRTQWMNLNGIWNFALDFGLSGVERGWPEDPAGLTNKINVPFCPESRLSGIGYTDFIPSVWYSRTFTAPEEWAGLEVFLHFGAVDYDCRVWVNGKLAGRHYGGSASFSFDITPHLIAEAGAQNTITVCAIDDTRSPAQPSGKQSFMYRSYGCHYTRVTGIWQTVWLEARPAMHIRDVQIVPDLDGGRFVFTPVFSQTKRGLIFRAVVEEEGNEIAVVKSAALSGATLEAKIPNPRAWSPADPHLYQIRFELLDNDKVIDTVASYAGLRKFHIEGNRFFLNNKPIFLRFVLDQGFYPDGIWTAPNDDALRGDIERSMAVGFNGARLHQKVFAERFHYWADRLGYLTWGEFDDWGLSFGSIEGIHNHQREWREVILRDRNHPSIVAWTPYNETVYQEANGAKAFPEMHRRAVQETVQLTRALDPTRPINDTSGYVHVETDIYTVHDYDQDAGTLRKRYAETSPDNPGAAHRNCPELSVPYQGQPYVVDEYGGTWWNEETVRKAREREAAAPGGNATGTDSYGSWGYGNCPRAIEEVYERIEKQTRVFTSHPQIAGFCYTQLTDVEQEQNGIYTYDRKPKFDAERLKKAFGAKAEMEKGSI